VGVGKFSCTRCGCEVETVKCSDHEDLLVKRYHPDRKGAGSFSYMPWVAKIDEVVGVEIRVARCIVLTTLPCGARVELWPGQPLPDKDVPCPCGNPKHWLWRFTDGERGVA